MDPVFLQLLSLVVTLLTVIFTLLYVLSSHLAKQDDEASHIPGCHRVGLTNHSHMNDEFSPLHSGSGDTLQCKVKALFMYPIKSCRRIELSTSDVVATGLRYDRQFCFAQLCTEEKDKPKDDISLNVHWTHKWKFITQRSVPQLSQIQTELWLPNPSSPEYSEDLEFVKSKGCLVCKFAFTPDWNWSGIFESQTRKTLWSIAKTKLCARSITAEPLVTFKLPIAPDEKRSAGYTREVMQIWKDSPEAINVTSEIPLETLARLKYFLGVSNPLGLFMADPMKRRDVFRNAPTKEEAGYQPGTGFADAYPLSIMGLASVQDVAKHVPIGKEMSALRFRANIYISGPPPYAEDAWKVIRIGRLSYHVSCRTTRCQLPNVDQETGVAHRQEPYLTLKKTRAHVDEGAGAHPCLGMQMVPLLEEEAGIEEIAVGQTVDVLKTGEHFYVRMFH